MGIITYQKHYNSGDLSKFRKDKGFYRAMVILAETKKIGEMKFYLAAGGGTVNAIIRICDGDNAQILGGGKSKGHGHCLIAHAATNALQNAGVKLTDDLNGESEIVEALEELGGLLRPQEKITVIDVTDY